MNWDKLEAKAKANGVNVEMPEKLTPYESIKKMGEGIRQRESFEQSLKRPATFSEQIELIETLERIRKIGEYINSNSYKDEKCI
jgi:hypothetical protein